MKRFFVVVLALLVVCSFLFLGQPAHAQGRVSAQCGHSYVGQQLDFSNLHAAGHKVVNVQLRGNNDAIVSCPAALAVNGKIGGYAAQTNRGSCTGYENFELATNNGQFWDCFFGTGALSVYITQIDDLFWDHYSTTINYTPPGQHWLACYDYNTAGFGSNDGVITVININYQQGGFCPDPLP